MNEELLLNYTFHIYSNNIEVINALKNDEIDIGLGLSITWKRALEVEFTQPIVDGSLRIMTKNRTGLNIWEMFMPFHWSLWVTILIIALINGNIIWLVERDSNSHYFPKFYFSGIREGLWFSFMNLMMMDDAVVRSFPVRKTKQKIKYNPAMVFGFFFFFFGPVSASHFSTDLPLIFALKQLRESWSSSDQPSLE
jgi:hypothetical protein